MIDLSRLTDELIAASLKILGVALFPTGTAVKLPFGPASTYVRAEGTLVVSWPALPTAPESVTAASVVAAHNGTPSFQQQLAAQGTLAPHVLVALLLESRPAALAKLSATHKAQVKQLLDDAASAIATNLN